MLVVVLVYQQIENNILTPKIQGKAVNLSGFFIIVAVTLFGALLGVLGALTAVPLAATIQIFVQELTKARREKVAAAKAARRSLDRDADRLGRQPDDGSEEHRAPDAQREACASASRSSLVLMPAKKSATEKSTTPST